MNGCGDPEREARACKPLAALERQQVIAALTEDSLEAQRAFLEKRPASFRRR